MSPRGNGAKTFAYVGRGDRTVGIPEEPYQSIAGPRAEAIGYTSMVQRRR